MTLSPGSRVGPYEVAAAIGEGGMGEVYRARDTRLGRTVAIKVLPAGLVRDPEARARLQHEAKAISALSHPNICTLFDVGHQDGMDFLVMEYLEGVTLAERLKSGPLPLDEATRIAAQVAAALSKAHEHGIVHRDLKPGNIMLTKASADRHGVPQARLLDFGLAKMMTASVVGVLRSSVATEQALTAQGTIVGTLSYMAPEQVEGREADARSDVFSLGAVLYEMVTGRQAFGGDNAASVIAAVLASEPAAPRSIRPEIHVALERLIVTCLAKHPEDRWQSALDVALYLEGLQDPAAPSRDTRPRLRRLVVAAAFVGGVALGLATGRLAWFGRVGSPPGPIVHLSVPLAASSLLVPQNPPRAGSNVAISRDGRHIVYVSRRNGESVLVLRALEQSSERVLPGTQGAFSPFFSPDGSWVAYFNETELRKVPTAGGGPVVVCWTPPVSRGGTWADDDTIYFAPDFTSGLQRVAASGGRSREVTALDLAAKESNHLFPEVLPGGDVLLFTAWKGGTFDAANVWAVSLRTGRRTLLIERAAEARYVRGGYLVFARGDTLFAAPFDPRSLTLLGPAAAVIEGVWHDPSTGTAHYAVSDNGTLVYAPGQYAAGRRQLAWVDRHGRVEPLPCESGSYAELKLSPDGKRLAVQLLNDLWVYDFQAGTMTRATFRGVNQAPVWAPDGRHLAFSSSKDVTRPTLYWVDPSAVAEPEILSRDGEVQFPASWSPDGSVLAFSEIKALDPESDFDIWLLAGVPPGTRHVLIRTPFKDDQPMFSPDGKALAWVSSETGRSEVYLRAHPGAGRTLVSRDGGTEPVWSRSGTELFYRKGRRLFSVPVSTRGPLTIGQPSLLFEGDFVMGSVTPGIPAYDVAPDGQRFIMVTSPPDTESPTGLDVVTNWVTELERRAPRRAVKTDR